MNRTALAAGAGASAPTPAFPAPLVAALAALATLALAAFAVHAPGDAQWRAALIVPLAPPIDDDRVEDFDVHSSTRSEQCRIRTAGN